MLATLFLLIDQSVVGVVTRMLLQVAAIETEFAGFS